MRGAKPDAPGDATAGLHAPILFGNLDDELLRQYVLAVVGYLVGRSMRSQCIGTRLTTCRRMTT
jgi:hypothetical protein